MKEDFLKTFNDAKTICGEKYKFIPEHVAQRRLANMCLSYLIETKETRFVDLCKYQFSNADNMTDEYAALSCLTNIDGPVSSMPLLDFYNKWNSNSLVLDRWFAVQAMSSLPGAVDRVEKLMSHKDFSLSNPNKLRSLVVSFCRGNPEQFHSLDGSGYKFLGRVIRTVDPINPQMGSALTKIFQDWAKYDAVRQDFIKSELEMILENDGISANTIEVATTALRGTTLSAKM